jgi:G:T-mismatch repair DNA endonuclease (very short patch repair protein)
VITVWECELKPKQRTETLARLVQQIREQVDR